jgi:death-on-curing protein
MSEFIWLEEHEVLRFHDRLLVLHGGATGVRDQGLLKSALARPKQHAAYGEDHDVILLAAVYTAGIVKNHPFVDGNKRTGFLVGILFLELNGYLFHASQEDAASAVISLASGEATESDYANFLRANSRIP